MPAEQSALEGLYFFILSLTYELLICLP